MSLPISVNTAFNYEEPEETHILPDDPDLGAESNQTLEFDLNQLTEDKPGKIKRRRKTLSCFNEDGSYVSSICESVKLRQRRKSIYVNNEEGDYVSNKESMRKEIARKKTAGRIKVRRKSIAISQEITSTDLPRPAKITQRRKTMYSSHSSDFMQAKREAVDEEIPGVYAQSSVGTLSQYKETEETKPIVGLEYNRESCQTPLPVKTTPKAPTSAGSSRRKSLLKPMDTEVKFEKVSYKAPNPNTAIPNRDKYKSYINIINKMPNKNEQIIRRLACLKVFRQYFQNELYALPGLSKSMTRALKCSKKNIV